MKQNIGAAILLAFALPLTGFLGGCATVTTGASQSLTVNSQPAGATCTLSRGGSDIAVINPTPGTAVIGKSFKAVDVHCKKSSHFDASGAFLPTMQPMVFGNILIGGALGVLIDAASGAMTHYPDTLTLILIPSEFSSLLDRDKYFDGLREECINECTKKVANVKAQSDCHKPTNGDLVSRPSMCEDMIKDAEKVRDSRLAEIEKMKISAKVAQPKSLNTIAN